MSQTDRYADIEDVADSSNDFDVKKERLRTSTITVATLTSVCVNIGLTALLVLFLNNDKYKEDRQTSATLRVGAEQLRDSVCVECRILGLSHDQALSSKAVQFLSVRDGELCCLPEAQSLWRLLNLYNMKLRMKQRTGTKNTKDLPLPSAHLYLDTLEENNYKWSEEYGFGAAHVIKPIQIKNGRLYIEKAGFYNIYSFITFKRRDAKGTSEISHSVMRISKNRLPHICLVLQKEIELPRHSETFNTSYLSAVIQLDSGDQLYVEVSDKEAIYRFAPSNFFGIHLVQEL